MADTQSSRQEDINIYNVSLVTQPTEVQYSLIHLSSGSVFTSSRRELSDSLNDPICSPSC